jgi:DNA-binding beta-propeller fold protein YncE
VGGTAWSMAVDPVTGRVYVLAGPPSTSVDGFLVVVDTATTALIAKIDPGSGVFDSDNVVAVNPSTGCVYIVGGRLLGTTVVDASTNRIVGRLASTVLTNAVAFDTPTNRVFVAAQGDILVIDGSTNAMIGVFSACCFGPMAIHPGNGRLYATIGVQMLVVVDGATGAVIKNVTLPNRPDRIVIDPASGRVYAANSALRTVTVIDAATNEIVETSVVAQTMGNGIAVDPRSGRIYIVDQFPLPRVVDVLE